MNYENARFAGVMMYQSERQNLTAKQCILCCAVHVMLQQARQMTNRKLFMTGTSARKYIHVLSAAVKA